MRRDPDRERLRQALAACAEEVFDALDPDDLAALVAGAGSRPELRDEVVERAEAVVRRLAGTADAVGPRECHLLVAACFTWSGTRGGVARNSGHAARKFLRYRRFVDVPLNYLVRTDRVVPDDERTAALLALSLRVRAGLAEAGADQEPELILNMVVPAIVAALGPDRPAGPDAGAALVGAALDVLARGAELAAAHRATRRSTGTGLPVAGNTDFLVRIAAYRVALDERRGAAVPADAVGRAADDLVAVLRRAMNHPAGGPHWRGPGEPDVASAFGHYAGHLGEACGTAAGRRAVKAVHSVLSHRLGLGDKPDHVVVEDFRSAPPPSSATETRPDVEHLVGWLIAALFRGAGPDAREPLLQWLDGKQVPDEARNLALLVRRLRVATAVLDRAPASRPPRPAGVPESRFQALTARLAATVAPADVTDDALAAARLVTLSALPPLWTRRRPAVLLVTSHLRVLLGGHRSAAVQAVLVAAHGVRAPVQFVQKASGPPAEPCCPDAAGGGWSPGGRPREPVHYQEVCPHRPWGEVGWVENYRTLGAAAGATSEAVRRQLERYQGAWRELLWP
ncbi:ATP-binding protein [Saccharothrix syringae]|uniref:Uncharacterized protein n=1 Tax=Saccharothrix syringae TaxID=103733 RepID=A0A5Q0H076_SACSY|nr:hypothetical protein [Saccharothrix syringae]QFZ19627.1 hypothetical protein EKG83_21290 [Saccharothrix syringae]